MNVSLKPLIQLIVFACLLLGCSSKETRSSATITIYSTTQTNAEVKISRFSLLEQTTLFTSRTDSTGYCTFEMPVDTPMFAQIQVGERYGEVYLSPDSELTIKENGRDYKIPLTFSGKGSAINNYVSWVNSNVEAIKWANGRGIGELDFDEFSERFDSLKNTISGFHKSYLDTVSVTDEQVAALKLKNKVKLKAVEQEYGFYQLNNSLNERFAAENNGMTYIEPPVLTGIEKVISDIPFDTILLADAYLDYQILLNFHWHNKISLPTSRLIGPNGSHTLAPLMSNSLIQQGNYPEGIREFLLAFNLHYWLSAFGITPETDSLFSGFKRRYVTSEYLPALNKNYNEWIALSPGRSAPHFEGYTPDGKKLSLENLKGKVIYMDVWATWCGPCIEEIPAAKALQQEFADEGNIQFVNVSVDADKTHWEKFLKKESQWKGFHVIIAPEMIQSFYAAYKLNGVPGYMLIDQYGNIANVKAARPSDPEISGQIKQLLRR